MNDFIEFFPSLLTICAYQINSTYLISNPCHPKTNVIQSSASRRLRRLARGEDVGEGFLKKKKAQLAFTSWGGRVSPGPVLTEHSGFNIPAKVSRACISGSGMH